MTKKLMLATVLSILVISLVIGGCSSPGPTQTAQGIWPEKGWEPPDFINVASTSTKGTGYTASVAASATFQEVSGVKFTTIPGDETMDRMLPLRQGESQFCWSPADDLLFMLQGALLFDQPQWGPQSVRAVYIGGALDQGYATRANSGIKTWADLKGKKLAQYPKDTPDEMMQDAIFAYLKAHPDYPDLTWADVEPVPVAGFGEGQDSIISGASDMAKASAGSSGAQELAASINGIHWMPLPNKTAGDKAAWAAFQEVLPCLFPNTATLGAGLSPEKPADIWGYSYHVVAYDYGVDDNLAFWMTKLIHENYEGYKGSHAYLEKWTEARVLNTDGWFVPWHEGSIKYWKAVGKWTDEMEAKQQAMLKTFPATNTTWK
ncbi:TAXI family TRAP transporter solute-binding subunit [Chloroflexota bacterium]